MNDNVRLSKTLSYWLRHRPDAAGLVLDPAGWAPLDQVLEALSREIPGTGLGRLLQVVQCSDKQRFEISGDKCRIRARQGHSMKVEADWPVTQPPPFLFHGTPERIVPVILAEGLKPMKRHHVHLSADAETAARVGSRRGPPAVLRVAAADMFRAGHLFRLSSNGVWLTDDVPPEFLGQIALWGPVTS